MTAFLGARGARRQRNDGLAEARASLGAGEIVADAFLTVDEAMDDDAVRAAIEAWDPRSFASAELAEDAGFEVTVKVQLWDNGEVDAGWNVTAPEGLEDSLEALVWDGRDGMMTYTLTRSTRHPGWQLTSWARDGGPWGHVDIEGDVADAFDTSPVASGQSLTGLAQVVLHDGRVLVREGATRIAFNPVRFAELDELKRSLM